MLNPKKSLGQNFLIDKNIIKKIVLLGKIKKADVLEIGAGTGNLTNEILKYEPRKTILVEKDSKLCQVFKEKFNSENADFVFFALSVPDYENLSLNMAEMKRYIEQQKTIIVYYEKSINNEYKAQIGVEEGNE